MKGDEGGARSGVSDTATGEPLAHTGRLRQDERTDLLMTLTDIPAPEGPQWVTLSPISLSNGSAAAKQSSRPPTRNCSLPDLAAFRSDSQVLQ